MYDVEIVNIDGKLFVRTTAIWVKFGYASHKNLIDVIKGKKERFERNEVLAYDTLKLDKSPLGGRPTKGYLLSERQFITLVQYVHNTEETMDFKDAVTDKFFLMRDKLAQMHTPTAYIDQVRKILLLDAPTEWVKLFPDSFYISLMQLYGKQFISNKHTPPYVGQITKKWIYDVVLPVELNNEIDAQRKAERKHQWFTQEKGREILLKQINDVSGIAKQSRDRKEFEARCSSMFNNEPYQLMLMI